MVVARGKQRWRERRHVRARERLVEAEISVAGRIRQGYSDGWFGFRKSRTTEDLLYRSEVA